MGSSAAVWLVLARTDWLNRAIGLPPVRYTVASLPDGGSQITHRAPVFGVPLTWQAFPLEWSAAEFYPVRRVVTAGPRAPAVLGRLPRGRRGGVGRRKGRLG